ncbi:hypothetical protein [Halorhodospira halochloris]|nr:hypothetical protein [Halorhodospira halochloris]
MWKTRWAGDRIQDLVERLEARTDALLASGARGGDQSFVISSIA